MTNDDDDAQVDGGTRRLTTHYICALSAVALLSIAGQVLVQSQLARQRHDSKVVNLAGRQRMLGQRVCKCAALLSADGATSAAAPYLEELRETLPTWRHNHAAMQNGDADLGLPGDNSPAVADLFERLNPTFEAMYGAAARLPQTAAPSHQREAAAIVFAQEPEYLRGMDSIVSQYESEAGLRVARLQTVERVLFGLALIVLLLEGRFIFRPAARRIRSSFEALRQAGDELRHAKEVAESASSAKSTFLANMSHELRTPLHAVLGAAELARQSTSDDGRREYLNIVEDSGRMLLCMMNDLLDLSKIEAGKMDLHPAPFELREFLGSTTAMFSVTARAKQVELDCVSTDDVPRFITADALRLRQVFANLLHNALKFTDSGSVVLRASATTRPDGIAKLRFEVVDTGVGISPADQARIFDAFTQVRSADDVDRGGVGLGLGIASRLVALMDGRFEVLSEPGRGSTFAFEIECPATDDAGVVSRSPVASRPIGSLRILAAEDAPMIRRILEEMLRGDGHDAQCVADGREAVALFEQDSFDLVLLDLRMPEVDGLTAAAAIREYERSRSRPRTPIIALTAASPLTVDATALPPEFDGVLTKPFTGEMLQQIIRRFAPTPVDSERASRVVARLQGRRVLLNELVELFLQDAPKLLDEIQRACETDDRRRLKTAVHRLRGQLEMLEVRDVAEIAYRLEQDCDEGRTSQLKSELAYLKNAWPAMCREIAQLASA